MSEFYDRLRPVLEKISAEAMADIELRETIAVLQTELRSAQENWKAACLDIAERDATIAALRSELARYKAALQAISLGPPDRMLNNNVDRWATDVAGEALGPPSGETSAPQ